MKKLLFPLLAALLIGPADRAGAERTPAQEAAYRRIVAAEVALDHADSSYNGALDKKSVASSEYTNLSNGGWQPGLFLLKLPRAKKSYNRAKDGLDNADDSYINAAQEYIGAEQQYEAAYGEPYDPQQLSKCEDMVEAGSISSYRDSNPATAEGMNKSAKDLQELMDSGAANDPKRRNEVLKKTKGVAAMSDQILNDVTDDLIGAAGASGAKGGITKGGAGGGAGANPMLLARAPGGAAGPGGISRSAAYGARPKPPGGAMSKKALMERKILISDSPRSRGRDPRAKGELDAARQYMTINDPRKALLAANKAIFKAPGNYKGYLLRAQALNKLRRFKEAQAAAQRAVELNPNSTDAYKSLIWAQLHTGDYRAAAANATRLIMLNPDDAEAYALRAFAFEMLGDRERMLRDLERAARLDPSRFGNHLARAKAGLSVFDPTAEDSERLLEAIAAPPPAGPGPLTILGGLLLALAAGSLLMFLHKRKADPEAPPGKMTALIAAAVRAWTPIPRTPLDMKTEPRSGEAPAGEAVHPGDVLNGKYRLKAVVGRGGMGKVWSAKDLSLERYAAVKEMSAYDGEESKELRDLFIKEARTIASLRHPTIVDIYEILDLPEGLFLVFEWVSGKTLHQILVEKKRLSIKESVSILTPVCKALEFAHSKGFIHRDLKPANIMVSAEGRIKLMDFGIARAVGSESPMLGPEGQVQPLLEARTRTVAGTPAYRSPEALEGVVTPALDVFSLGVCLYEMLVGRLPFDAGGLQPGEPPRFSPPSEAVKGLSGKVDELVAAALEPDHRKRMAGVREFLSAMRAL